MTTLKINIIETERLSLREITPEVYKMIFTFYTDEQLMDFFGFQTLEELREEKQKYAKGKSTYNKSFHYYFLIEKATNKNIGWCGFHTWYLDHRRAELGYGLNFEDEKRKGLMTEALKPIIDYGFTIMNLNRIEAFTSPKNIASIKMLKNFGFIEEGLLRKHYFKNEVMEDSAVYGLLREGYSNIK